MKARICFIWGHLWQVTGGNFWVTGGNFFLHDRKIQLKQLSVHEIEWHSLMGFIGDIFDQFSAFVVTSTTSVEIWGCILSLPVLTTHRSTML